MVEAAGTATDQKAAELEQQLVDLEAADRALTEVHLLDIDPTAAAEAAAGNVTAPTKVEPPTPADIEEITARHRREALAGIKGFRPFARRRALAQADSAAVVEAADLNRANLRNLREAASDTVTVDEEPAGILTAALTAHGLDFECVVHEGSALTVIGTFGSPEIVADRVKSETPAGKTTTKKRTKTERNAVYAEALGSTVLAVAKNALALVPAADKVRVVVVQEQSLDDVLFTGTFPRSFLADIDWGDIEPGEEIQFADDMRFRRKGVAQEVVPVEVDDEGLAALIADFRN